MTALTYANNAKGTLASGISAVATSFTLSSSAQAATFPLTGPFYATLTDASTGTIHEIVLVTAVTGLTYTCTRGQDNTTAVAWNAADFVTQNVVAAELRDFLSVTQGGTITGAVNAPTAIGPNQIVNLGQVQSLVSGSSFVNAVVIGDSLSAQNNLLDFCWPEIFARNMRNAGATVNVTNIAVDGHSFFRANTVTSNGTRTAVQETIALAPGIVFVMLGYNDSITNVDGRTLAQTQADATTCFNALAAGLPTAKIVYISELTYDSADFTPATLKNLGVLPALMALPAAGITAGAYGSEMLPNAVSGSLQTAYANWVSLDTTCRGLASVTGTISMNYWRIARLGCCNTDGLHPTEMGSILQAGYVQKGLFALSFAATLFPYAITSQVAIWTDPDTLFTSFLSSAGGGVYNTTYFVNSEAVAFQMNHARAIYPDTWFYPYKTEFSFSPSTVNFNPSSTIVYTARSGPPVQTLSISQNGGAFAATSPANATDNNGFLAAFTTGSALALAAGSYTLRYKLGNEIYGPFTLTVQANTEPFVSAVRNSNQATNGGATFTQVVYNSVLKDQSSSYNSGTGNFTVPRAGKYMVTATAWLDALPAASQMFLSLYVNGSRTWDSEAGFNAAGVAAPCGASFSQVIDASAGQTLSINVWQNSGGVINIVPGTATAATHLSIMFLGY